ncbi:hypothetical protein [Sphingomonas bacterium]|uniref:hypothetical protein n=1 Tax=Sphingomonas bacterium TaxID=1895847 RepID=UPI001576BC41|nr:hypothetical protein [Sphingomonas bacterium]
MATSAVDLSRARWSRLLSEDDAAAYLSLGSTMFRGLGIKAKRIGRRVLWDIRDLDAWVDRMDDQPIEETDRARESADEEARFFARRRGNART